MHDPVQPAERDPGIFAVNDFLTDEDELRILEEVEAELAQAPRRDADDWDE